jgi:hypothetical protein
MALILAFVLAAAAPTPSPEAEALGIRLAGTGTLATLLPLMVAKETDELVASQTALNTADKRQLRRTAAEVAKRGIDRIMALEGHSNATLLSMNDLKALVSFSESKAAMRQRAIQPKVIAATMQGIAGMDFKKEVLAAFCSQTGKGCPTR